MKYLKILTVALFATSIISCGESADNDADDVDEVETTTEAPAPPQPPAPPTPPPPPQPGTEVEVDLNTPAGDVNVKTQR